jgi:hypothetical protein
MGRSGLYAVIAVLVVAVIGLGAYLVYQETHKPALAITVDKSGIQVQGNG